MAHDDQTASNGGRSSAALNAQPASPTLDPGTPVGPYILERFIGEGGMGQVYEARVPGRQVRLALKILRPGDTGREGELLEIAEQPGVVTILDRGWWTAPSGAKRYYIAMGLIRRALPLTEFARARRLDTPTRLALFLRVCGIVSKLHPRIVHYDLKPENILVDEDGHPFVCDLGLARLATDLGIKPPGGTPMFASPEQISSPVADLDHRADQFALGATLVELLTNRPPFEFTGGAKADLLESRRRGVRAISRWCAYADHRLDAIARRSTAFEREDRYRDVHEFAQAIEQWAARASTLRGRATRLWRRRPALRVAGRIAATATIGAILGGAVLGPMINRAVAWDGRVARTLTLPATHEHVLIVETPDGPSMVALARQLGISGLDPTVPATWRPVYAAMLDRVAGPAKVVAFDIAFWSPQPSDPHFGEAIRRAIAGGTPIVLSTRTRATDESDRPELSSALWHDGALWGYDTIMPGHGVGAPQVPLLTRAGDRTFPSLSLAVLAAQNAMGHHPSYELLGDRIRVRYWRTAPPREGSTRTGDRQWASHFREIPVANIENWATSARGQEAGFGPGDELALALAWLPKPEARAAATVGLAQLMLDPETLARCTDRTVLVTPGPRDPLQQVGTEMVGGAFVHASAIEWMLQGRSWQVWDHTQHLPAIAGLGLVGASLGCLSIGVGARSIALGGRRARLATLVPIAAAIRWPLVAATTAGTASLASILVERHSIIMSPVPACLALLVAAEAAALWAALAAPRSLPPETP